MTKRFINLLIICILALGLNTVCSSTEEKKPPPKEEPAPEPPPAEPTPAPAAEPAPAASPQANTAQPMEAGEPTEPPEEPAAAPAEPLGPAPEDYSVDDNLVLGGSSDKGNAGDLKSVPFVFASAMITKKATKVLNKNVEFLKANTNISVELEGHTDRWGGKPYNNKLGMKRAYAVKQYFVAMGIAKERITIKSIGEKKPLINKENIKAYRKNRRVNIVITAL